MSRKVDPKHEEVTMTLQTTYNILNVRMYTSILFISCIMETASTKIALTIQFICNFHGFIECVVHIRNK